VSFDFSAEIMNHLNPFTTVRMLVPSRIDGFINIWMLCCYQGTELTSYDEDGILKCDSYQQFWISWANGLIEVGKNQVNLERYARFHCPHNRTVNSAVVRRIKCFLKIMLYKQNNRTVVSSQQKSSCMFTF
jgi:hypothetical protein